MHTADDLIRRYVRVYGTTGSPLFESSRAPMGLRALLLRCAAWLRALAR